MVMGHLQEVKLIWIISGISIGITAYISYKLYKANKQIISNLEDEVKRYKFGIRSAYVKFGKSFEHFVPFTKYFKDKNTATFIGCPIDYICFDDDKIRFIEVKTGNSKLSTKQLKIKEMIQNKQVEFKEIRFQKYKQNQKRIIKIGTNTIQLRQMKKDCFMNYYQNYVIQYQKNLMFLEDHQYL